jgi:HK97 family phage major capsid protein
MKTTAEKIRELEDEIEDHRARMAKLLEDAEDDDEKNGDLDEDEEKEFAEEEEEKKKKELRLARLKSTFKSEQTAKPVNREPTVKARSERVPAEVKAPGDKGIGFARAVMCYAAAKGVRGDAVEIAKQHYPNQRDLQLFLKAPVSGGTTTEPTWAKPLVDPTNLTSEFIEFLRPQTILGKFGQGGVPGLRRIPFNVRITGQLTGGAAGWVGEGKGIPLTKADFFDVTLRWTKVGAISVLSEDLIRFSAPSAEVLVRDMLAEALVEQLDKDFINPSIGAVTDVRPAAVTSGAATTTASGIDVAAIKSDIKGRINTFIAANIATSGVVIVMRNTQASALAVLDTPLGVPVFPKITANGGELLGYPVIASQYVPQGVVVFLSAPDIFLADDGDVSVDMSREASLQMDSSPTMAMGDNIGSPYTPVPAQVVSMFQTSSVAIRALRMINWAKRRTTAVTYLTSTGWGNDDTSPPQPAI